MSVKEKSVNGYKVFTHDLRPPIQGGDPVWNGTLPYDLPTVEVDTSKDECASGWNFCTKPDNALFIAGLWPNGYPSRLFQVEAKNVIKRSNKCRTASLRIMRECDEDEIRTVVEKISEEFGEHRDTMVNAQMEWREALARPHYDENKVELGLREALNVRNLDWRLRRFESTLDVWTARDAWIAKDTRTERDTWTAWAAWSTRVTWTAQAVQSVWVEWGVKARMDYEECEGDERCERCERCTYTAICLT